VEKDKDARYEAITQFVDHKLTRLMKFYRYGLPKAGWNKYSYVNLEFDNQIVCKRRHDEKQTPVVIPAEEPQPAAPADTIKSQTH